MKIINSRQPTQQGGELDKTSGELSSALGSPADNIVELRLNGIDKGLKNLLKLVRKLKEYYDDKEEEFNLSEKIEEQPDEVMEEFELKEDEREWIYAKYVKEFIRLLKEECEDWEGDLTAQIVLEKINKLAGSKLI